MARHRPELDEDVDLDMDHRLYVLQVHEALSTVSYYELLRVPRSADKKEIKRAYFAFAGQFHPDRFRGKRLGSFKKLLDEIFSHVTRGHDVLTSEKRAAYDATLAPLAASGLAPAPLAAPVDPRVAEKRAQAMAALEARFREGQLKARELAAAAERARAAGDVVSARESYERALAITPNDAALRAAYAEVERATTERLADGHAKKAELEERFGQWEAAAQTWRRVVEARPHDTAAHERLANALARAAGARR